MAENSEKPEEVSKNQGSCNCFFPIVSTQRTFKKLSDFLMRLVKPLKNVLETARELGATDFVDYIEESGLDKELSTEGAFTLLAPTNEAFRNIPSELRGRIDSYRGNIENPILRYHVIDRKIMSDDFHADMTVPTLYNGNLLRINKYSSGV